MELITEELKGNGWKVTCEVDSRMWVHRNVREGVSRHNMYVQVVK